MLIVDTFAETEQKGGEVNPRLPGLYFPVFAASLEK